MFAERPVIIHTGPGSMLRRRRGSQDPVPQAEREVLEQLLQQLQHTRRMSHCL